MVINTNTIYYSNTLTKVFTIISTILLSSCLLAGLILTSSHSSADTVDDVSVTVPVSCNVTSNLDSAHTATINPGQYKEDVGTTTFKVFCNDNTGYALYAIGYSNEEYGNTNLLPTNTSNPAIATGLATSGDTSNWAMKLTPVTAESSGTEQPYVPTIESDTNGSFANYHIVPEEYTKVATFTSTTDFTIGSSLTSTYRVFIQGKQPADTYQGKVKYTLVHPNDAAVPETPIRPEDTAKILDSYSIDGSSFACAFYTLAKNGTCVYNDGSDTYVPNTNIKAIRMSTTPPTDIKSEDYYSCNYNVDYCNVAAEDSYNPIYAWFNDDNNEGIIYIYTTAKKIIMSESMAYGFSGLSALTDVSGLTNWDTSSVTDMGSMFRDASSLTNIDGASNWDTSSVTDMGLMFENASSLTNIDGASNWNTSSVTHMSSMFYDASSLTNIDGAMNWDTSSVTDMNSMFRDASSLTNIDGASSWDTSSVTAMSGMFFGASSLTNIDGASNWNTFSVTHMGSMFRDASSLTNIDALSSWDTSSVTSMDRMFNGATSLIDISGAANWNTSNVTNIIDMFNGANNIDATVLNNWDVSKVTNKSGAFTCPFDKLPSWY